MAKKAPAHGVEGVDFEVVTLDVAEDLDLDPENPRLSQDEQGASQARLLELMIERFKITELAESIVAAGYNEFDPLVGFRATGQKKTTILEGNRRVATIQLLLNPDLAPKAHRERWKELAGELPSDTEKAIRKLPVRVYKMRDAVPVLSYIGFRHVTGVLTWSPLEKAQYIAGLVDKAGWSYREIAQRLGSYPKIVERHFVAYRMVRQAQEEEFEGAELLQNGFGILTRALQASGIPDFLGLEYPGDPKKSRNPVPRQKLPHLEEFIKWTFGTEKLPPVIKDSRQLTVWGKILKSSEAVAYLRRTPSPQFERAWVKSGGQAESVAESLYTAADRLEESAPLVSEHLASDEVIAAMNQCTRFFVQVAAHFPDIAEKYGLEFKNV